jgi:ribosomal protein S12 methylthiotransferase accessory factor YcaO
MKIINSMQKPDLPGTLLLQPAGLLALPNAAEVSDVLSVNGSGVGGGSNSIKTALGEYFERRHFYREILSKKKGVLGEFLTDTEVASFTGAFRQTASSRISIEALEAHRFTLSQVVRTLDFSTCFIPTICISLSSHGLQNDNFIYPRRDTCGCSFHWRADFAFLGAVKEYLERQFLLKFWLTKRCRSRVCLIRIAELLVHGNVKHLYDLLAASGEIAVFDISDSTFPGVCILVVYGRSKDRHHVKYCAGMSYAPSMAEALVKSILELWQTYRFINLFESTDADPNKVEDDYLRYFLECNSYETYQEVSDVLVSGGDKEERGAVDFTLLTLLSVLNDQGVAGYLYSRQSKVNGVAGVFCKYVSPDLFLHMDSSQNINGVNKYSKRFAAEILPSRMGKMVPFP